MTAQTTFAGPFEAMESNCMLDGVIISWPGKTYGFIRGQDGRSYYVHIDDLHFEISRLSPEDRIGMVVRFHPVPTDVDGRGKAQQVLPVVRLDYQIVDSNLIAGGVAAPKIRKVRVCGITVLDYEDGPPIRWDVVLHEVLRNGEYPPAMQRELRVRVGNYLGKVAAFQRKVQEFIRLLESRNYHYVAARDGFEIREESSGLSMVPQAPVLVRFSRDLPWEGCNSHLFVIKEETTLRQLWEELNSANAQANETPSVQVDVPEPTKVSSAAERPTTLDGLWKAWATGYEEDGGVRKLAYNFANCTTDYPSIRARWLVKLVVLIYIERSPSMREVVGLRIAALNMQWWPSVREGVKAFVRRYPSLRSEAIEIAEEVQRVWREIEATCKISAPKAYSREELEVAAGPVFVAPEPESTKVLVLE